MGAHSEGWLDTTLDTARQGVASAVETTTWAAQKGAEATSSTYSYLNEGGTKDVLEKTTEAFGSTAKKSISLVGDSVDWLSSQVVPQGSERGLANMSSGTMQGFGPDSLPCHDGSGSSSSAASASASPMPMQQTRFSGSHVSYHCDPGISHSDKGATKPPPVASLPIPEVGADVA